jgi:hypothetical protein
MASGFWGAINSMWAAQVWGVPELGLGVLQVKGAAGIQVRGQGSRWTRAQVIRGAWVGERWSWERMG